VTNGAGYRLAIRQGSSVAALSLGNYFEIELEDSANALACYVMSCEMGCGLACNIVSLAYLGGRLDLEIDEVKAKNMPAGRLRSVATLRIVAEWD
jgi:TPR repeat protein